MTVKDVYKNTLIELHKINAPSLKLSEFNYFCDKAINQVVNKIYNIYDINQQTTDDLRVLHKSITYTKGKIIQLPSDYLHLLNCICIFSDPKCGKPIVRTASKLNLDIYPEILLNAYNKPSYKKPYFLVNSQNLEIICGEFEPKSIQVNYLKIPTSVLLTLQQITNIIDTSAEMEFPDYINQEIINELVHLVMERSTDPRLATNLQITQSIARPTQQLETK